MQAVVKDKDNLIFMYLKAQKRVGEDRKNFNDKKFLKFCENYIFRFKKFNRFQE